MKHLSLYIYLIIALGINSLYAQSKIISEGDNWLYYDQKPEPNKNWKKRNTDNSGWKIGNSPLGYGDSAVKHNISFGDDPENKINTYYFKKVFTVKNPYQFIAFRLEAIIDDGAIIYLNGREVFKINMPEKEYYHNTFASSSVVIGEVEGFVHTKVLSPEDFLSGENIITATLHNSSKTSNDVIFSIELIGDNDSNILPKLMEERNIKNLKLDIELKELKFNNQLEKLNLKSKTNERAKDIFKWLFITFLLLFLALIVYQVIIQIVFNKKEKKLIDIITGFEKVNTRKDIEMMSNSLKALNNKQYLKELKRDIEKTIKTKGELDLRNDLKIIIKQIDFNIEHNEDTDSLKKHFGSVHKNFFDKLREMHPTLTEIDLRHCMFIKLHMQTKEIANILHVDARSVQAARYRIKKKMKLNEQTDLKTYLHEF